MSEAVGTLARSGRHAAYDVVVVGGGVAGVAAAATLARHGRKVLLVEKAPRVGGLTAPLVHGPYEFDAGPRLVMGGNADGPFGPGGIHAFLDWLGVLRQVDFIPVQPMAHVQFPGLLVRLWSGRQRFTEGIAEAVPRGVGRLPALLDLCGRLFAASKRYLSDGRPWSAWRMLVEMPEFVRYAGVTAEAVLERYIPDRRARTVVGSLWPYLGVRPRQASFLAWSFLMATYVDEGAYFCRGGLHRIADAIAAACTAAGGEIRVGSAATRLLVRNRQVTGVELATGERIAAPAVVATLDPREVFGAMVSASEFPPRYRRRLARLVPSDPGISVSMVTDADLPALGLAFENIRFGGWEDAQGDRHPAEGESGFVSMHVTTIADPDLAPPGQHLLCACTSLPLGTPLRSDDVRRHRERVMGTVLTHVPQLHGHLVLAADPATAGGYLSHVFGPTYGWRVSPWQAILGRPDLHTPIKGVIIAGHWTRPAPGVMPAILSGREAANIILRAS
jgi:prolycopene isomerase